MCRNNCNCHSWDGPMGFTGPTGPIGFIGLVGDTGPQPVGTIGDTGATGPNGDIGATGPIGSLKYFTTRLIVTTSINSVSNPEFIFPANEYIVYVGHRTSIGSSTFITHVAIDSTMSWVNGQTLRFRDMTAIGYGPTGTIETTIPYPQLSVLELSIIGSTNHVIVDGNNQSQTLLLNNVILGQIDNYISLTYMNNLSGNVMPLNITSMWILSTIGGNTDASI